MFLIWTEPIQTDQNGPTVPFKTTPVINGINLKGTVSRDFEHQLGSLICILCLTSGGF